MGEPLCCTDFLWPSIDEGNVEVYRATSHALGLVVIVPVPSYEDMTHYALITYDASRRVYATDWDYVSYADLHMFLDAGVYGYFHTDNMLFPSKDGGGKADKAWASYMHYASLTRLDNRAAKRIALKRLCHAVEHGHPAAFSELSKLFWDTGTPALGQYILSSIFEKDAVKSCLWYSLANNKVQPSWCRNLLSTEDAKKVENLLEDWQQGQCDVGVVNNISNN